MHPQWYFASYRLLVSSHMLDRTDIEAAASREANNSDDTETDSLLPSSRPVQDFGGSTKNPSSFNGLCSKKAFGVFHIAAAFLLGAVACVITQYAICGTNCFKHSSSEDGTISQIHGDAKASALAPPYVGSTEVHHFPPTKPTNAFPSLFPSHVGYAGGTPTGAEPAVIATAPAYPLRSGQCPQQLIGPKTIPGQKHLNGVNVEDDADANAKKGKHGHPKSFDLFKSWGNLSPWYSVGRDAFGVDSTPGTPDTCVVTGLHFLHRHGARYPTAMCKFAPDF